MFLCKRYQPVCFMKKAEATRQAILQKAFELTYINGYQTTSIDTIIAATQVTKGAFYYHFQNKEEMGAAIINEILKPTLKGNFTEVLQSAQNPLDAIYDLMQHLLLKNDFLKVEYGCPAGNLTGEMTPWNPVFTKLLMELTEDWIALITQAIIKGKAAGFVRAAVNARQVALFVMSGYWGIRSFGKLGKSKQVYLTYLKELKNYLHTLK